MLVLTALCLRALARILVSSMANVTSPTRSTLIRAAASSTWWTLLCKSALFFTRKAQTLSWSGSSWSIMMRRVAIVPSILIPFAP